MGRTQVKTELPVITLHLPSKNKISKRELLRKNLMEQAQFEKTYHWEYIHQKLFAIILLNIDWEKEDNVNIVQLLNRNIADCLCENFRNEDDKTIWENLLEVFSVISSGCVAQIKGLYNRTFCAGNVVYGTYGNLLCTNVTLNPSLLPYFKRLLEAGYTDKFSIDSSIFEKDRDKLLDESEEGPILNRCLAYVCQNEPVFTVNEDPMEIKKAMLWAESVKCS